MTDTTCPTCGTPVRIVSSDEGTSYYEPLVARDDGLRAALVDLTAAYHHERKHTGRWDACQRPRCQNARLAMEGRGPFAALSPTRTEREPDPECVADGSHSDDLSHEAELRNRTGRHECRETAEGCTCGWRRGSGSNAWIVHRQALENARTAATPEPAGLDEWDVGCRFDPYYCRAHDSERASVLEHQCRLASSGEPTDD